jgi:hypothetical protein
VGRWRNQFTGIAGILLGVAFSAPAAAAPAPDPLDVRKAELSVSPGRLQLEGRTDRLAKSGAYLTGSCSEGCSVVPSLELVGKRAAAAPDPVILDGLGSWEPEASIIALHPTSKAVRRWLRHYDGPPLRAKLVVTATSPSDQVSTERELERSIRRGR